MTTKIDKYRGAPIQRLDEFMPPLPKGHGDIDIAARHILRNCRLSEHAREGNSPLIFLENETELKAAETLQDRGFGHVELRKTGAIDRFNRFEIGWIFIGKETND